MKSLQSATQYITKGQYSELFRGITRRIPRWLFRRSNGFIFELGLPSPSTLTDSGASAERCQFVEVDLAAISEIALEAGISAREAERRFASGDRCVAAILDGRPAHLAWLHFGPCYVRGLSLQLDLRATECYVYGVFTAPRARGRGVYRAAQRWLLTEFLEPQGVRGVTQLVEKGNEVPLNVLPELGYQCTREIRHLTFVGVHSTVINSLTDAQSTRQLRIAAPVTCFQI